MRSLMVQGEQAGLGLDDESVADQALELGAHALDVLGLAAEVERPAQVAGASRRLGVGEGGEDVLVGRVFRQRT
ncbi:hypothetical protein ACH4TQ_47385 [Streptomyces sp. NPDC021218]|uniref:hypothetical protein n=1 Tax=Streptomyces sp. NPDC021218 TaxID=3365119 RepID=UPI0037A97B32